MSVLLAHRTRWTSAQVFHSMTGVKAGVQVQGMPLRQRLRERYPVLTCERVQSQRLSGVVSKFGSKAIAW